MRGFLQIKHMNKFLILTFLLINKIAFAAFPVVTDIATITSEETESMFNFGGFLLGLLLGIYGVIIAYLIKDKKVVKSSWRGFGVRVFIIICLYALIVFRFNGGINFPL